MNLRFDSFTLSIRTGALIPLLIMLPNLLWALLSKNEGVPQNPAPGFLTIIENIGRVGILLLPFFYSLNLTKSYSKPVIFGMGLMLLIYYASWFRYFNGGSSPELFKAPFLGIPLPMAVTPVLFLVLSSYLMGSWLMFGVSILFGIAHIWVSALSL